MNHTIARLCVQQKSIGCLLTWKWNQSQVFLFLFPCSFCRSNYNHPHSRSAWSTSREDVFQRKRNEYGIDCLYPSFSRVPTSSQVNSRLRLGLEVRFGSMKEKKQMRSTQVRVRRLGLRERDGQQSRSTYRGSLDWKSRFVKERDDRETVQGLMRGWLGGMWKLKMRWWVMKKRSVGGGKEKGELVKS